VTTATLTRLAVPAMRKRALALLGALLVALAVIPYALGWLAGVVVQVSVWAWSGLVVGWLDGRATIRKGWSS
jgi:hypothetical protein